MQSAKPFKIPESVLVVIHTPELQVLLIERADHPGYWQSVTGSRDGADEPLVVTARLKPPESPPGCAAGCAVRAVASRRPGSARG